MHFTSYNETASDERNNFSSSGNYIILVQEQCHCCFQNVVVVTDEYPLLAADIIAHGCREEQLPICFLFSSYIQREESEQCSESGFAT